MRYLIDTHFHLDYYKNHSELFEKINQLEQYTICMTTSPGVYYSCKQLYKNSKYIQFALGFHPQMEKLNNRDFNEFEILLSETKYVGEIGLDFTTPYREHAEKQVGFFDKIIKTCAANDKIISVHLRNDRGKGVNIIEKYMPTKCIIHWFHGSAEELNKLINLNCYFSINENMIRNPKTQQYVRKMPRSKLLIESDGPFTKVCGKKYQPDMLFNEYENIAKFLDEPSLISLIYSNFKHILSAT